MPNLEDENLNLDDIRIRKPPPSWTTTASISCVLAWGALAVHNLYALPRLDGVPNVSFDRVTGTSKFGSRYARFDERIVVKRCS